MYNFKNKTIFITGGSTGMGYSTAEHFLRADANVIFVSRNRYNGSNALARLKQISPNAEYICADVSNESEIKEAVNTAYELFGSIDFAFNNAGVEGDFDFIDNLSFEQFKKTIEINLFGVFLSMKYEIALMLKQEHGVIVNTSSVSGMMNFPKGSPYVVSKHGVESLTKCIALEYASRNIRINSIAPGEIDTPMSERSLDTPEKKERITSIIPMKYIANPDVIAQGIMWLCSENASYITGATIPIDGGFTAKI